MLAEKVWRKTEKGEDEILTGKYRLPQDMRRVLTLVDGLSDESKVVEKGLVLREDIHRCLRELAEQRYIDQEIGAITILDVKRELARITREALGSDGDTIAEKIMDAPDRREGLTAALHDCRKPAWMIVHERNAKDLIRKWKIVLERLA